MNWSYTVRVACLVGVMAALAGCPPAPDECADVSIAITSPAADAQVNPTIDVEVTASTKTGTTVAIATASISTKLESASTFGALKSGSVSAAKATFRDLALQAGRNELRVLVDTSSPACQGKTASIFVTASSVALPPKVTSVRFPQDANTDGTLNRAELPANTKILMEVSADNTASNVTVRAKRGSDVVGAAVAFAAGKATIVLDQLPETDSGSFDVVAELLVDGTAIAVTAEGAATIKVQRVAPTCTNTTKTVMGPGDNQVSAAGTFGFLTTGTVGSSATSATFRINGGATSPMVTPTNGMVSSTALTATQGATDTTYDIILEARDAAGNTCSSSASVRVDLAPPSCTNTTKLVMGPSDDQTPAAATFSLRATGTVGMGATSATIGIMSGATSGMLTPTGTGAVSFDLTVPKSGDQTHQVVVSATDAAGNSCSAVAVVRVDLVGPVVTITAPSNPDGGVPQATSTPVNVVVSVTGAPDDAGVTVSRSQDGGVGVSVGSGNLVSGGATIAVPFSVDGLYLLSASVLDDVGNQGTASQPVQVQLAGCGVSFTTIDNQLAQCPTFLSRLPIGNAVQVQITSNVSCAGQPITMKRNGQTVATNTSGTFTVPLSDGTFTLRAEIPNLVGAPSFAECEVEVNTSAFPNIVSPAGLSGTDTVINASQDSNTATAGAQRLLSFNAQVPTGGHVDVCVDTNSATVVPQPAVACTDGEAGWYVLQSNVTSPVNAFTYPEGNYKLKVVAVPPTGAGLASPAVSLLVDVTAPCVTSAGVTLPQDTVADGKLNRVELGSAAPSVSFTANAACGSATTVQVKNVTGGAIGTTTYSPSTTVSPGAMTLSLTQNILQEQNLDVFVELTDAAGNKNTLTSNAPARKTFVVDTRAPDCAFFSPSKAGTLNVADAPGGMLSIQVQTSADVPTVVVTRGSDTPVSVAPMSNLATTTVAVSGTTTFNLLAECTDAAGNLTTVNRSTSVDLDVPTCAFTAPTANSTSGTRTVAATVTVSGAETNQPVVFTSTGTAGVLASVPVAGASVNATVSLDNGVQTLTARVSDVAGNECVATVGPVTVNSDECDLSLVNGAPNGTTVWFNLSNTTAGTGATRTSNIGATSALCATGNTVVLKRLTPAAGTVATSATAAGSVSFASVVLTSGETYQLEIDNGAGKITQSRVIGVDFVAPAPPTTVTIDGRAVPSSGPFFFVANGHNRQYALGTAGYFEDKNVSLNGAQVNLQLTGITGALNGTVSVWYQGTQLAGATVTSSSYAFAPGVQTFAHDSTGTFTIQVADEAGNLLTVASGTASVDVIEPAAPGNVTRTLADERDAKLTLAWDPVKDDSTTSAGDVRDYQIRWTTLSVVGNNQMQAEADFFGSSSASDSAAASGSRISKDLILPPLNDYFVAVRARDEVDNYSTFVAPGSPVQNRWTKLKLTAPSGIKSLGTGVAADSSLNSDSVADLVVGAGLSTATAAESAVLVYYGGTGFSSQSGTCSLPSCQVLQAPDIGNAADAGTGFNFGSDFSAHGNFGDVGAERVADLAVAQLLYPTNATSTATGRVFLFFGASDSSGTSIDTSKTIEIRGDATAQIGYFVRVIADLDNDGLSEVMIGAPRYRQSPSLDLIGRVYIFKGRSQAEWVAASTQTDAQTGAKYISISSATWTINGPTPPVVANPTTSASFARNRMGSYPIADFDNDGRPDFTIGFGPSTANRLQVWGSKTIADAGVVAFESTSAATTLTQNPFNDSNATVGFGTAVLGAFNLTDGPEYDLVVTYPAAGSSSGWFYIYKDMPSLMSTVGAKASSYTVVGPKGFGNWLAAGNLNTGDTQVDLVVGQSATASIDNSSGWILWHVPNAGATSPYETPLETPGRFWVSKLVGSLETGTDVGLHSFGKTVAVADLTADVVPRADVVFTDEKNGAVYVYR